MHWTINRQFYIRSLCLVCPLFFLTRLESKKVKDSETYGVCSSNTERDPVVTEIT